MENRGVTSGQTFHRVIPVGRGSTYGFGIPRCHSVGATKSHHSIGNMESESRTQCSGGDVGEDGMAHGHIEWTTEGLADECERIHEFELKDGDNGWGASNWNR